MDGRLVLVADDDADVRDLIRVALEKMAGVRTIPAENGYEALRLVREIRPLLVLLDVGLARLDGCQVARRLKANRATRRIPVIAVSRRARAEAMRAGCDDHIGMPFGLDDLVAKVREHLPPLATANV